MVEHDDLALLHAQRRHLVLGQGDSLVGLAHEASDAADVADQVPSIVRHDHLDEDIAGKYLPLHFLHHAGLGDLGDRLHRDLGLEDHVLHPAVHHGFFDGGLYRVFIAGIGMCHIPLCVISHVLYLRTDR